MTTSNTHISRRRGPSDRPAGLDLAASQQGAEAVQGKGLKSRNFTMDPTNLLLTKRHSKTLQMKFTQDLTTSTFAVKLPFHFL